MLLFNMHVGNTVPVKGRPPQSGGTCSSWGHKPPIFHHRILKSLEIFELFIRRAFPHPSFCLCLLCCVLMFLLFIILTLTDTGFTFFLRSTAVKAHAQSSFNICSNPCSSCRLNGSYFWFPPPPFSHALNATIQTLAGVSHPPVLSMQMLSFPNAQMANKIKDELKGKRREREEMILGCVSKTQYVTSWKENFCVSVWLHSLAMANNAQRGVALWILGPKVHIKPTHICYFK